nr:AN1-type zinc finger protein 2A isoform X5 [Bubalus bubalis]XP_025130842.1 AN1-type zinc finger protein 2A isoform X5 [Bubalus bubalis]XP_025130843.1 AN1-type zinc finger protein 2A isoform X5 [Bubalus bubalis]XP_025130844.1 AN1-type zinc finger protein 2A isoform X5 [Bubalus bubalis]XP_025130845.1 AN1-type zinc finger protein 2A isoform X5 [Bubalus bubalis]XP_025130846.1 AN1-type zinc finger protein 2A isoform X5 [Bubalus bubalis]
MDGDCRRPPGQETAKVFTFRCSREGCRRREMLRVVCEECRGSFCLQHRHPLDHGCARRGHPGSLAGGRQVSPWQPSSLCGQTVTPSPHYELGFTHCQPPALPMGLGLPHSGRLLMAAQPLRWLAARRAPSGTWTIRPTCCRRSESPLPLPVTVSCGVCLNQAEGPLIPAHVASVLEVQSKVMA